MLIWGIPLIFLLCVIILFIAALTRKLTSNWFSTRLVSWPGESVLPFFSFAGIVLILAMSLGPVAEVVAVQARNAQPELVQIAALDSAQIVDVIVRKSSNSGTVERAVARLGGTITKDLSIINAIAVRMPAGVALTLSTQPEVRWVSLDSPTTSSDEGTTEAVFITWAETQGYASVNTFQNQAAIFDSLLGPNGTFGYGSGFARGSFGGFEPQISPDTNISKVELVVQAYMTRPVSRSLRFMVYIGGNKINEVRSTTSIFNQVIGQENANLVFVDITGSYNWQWSDFHNDLQVVLDHAVRDGLLYGEQVYYDAIGLRVTSLPGTTSVSQTLGDPSALAFIVPEFQENVYNQAIRASDLWNEGVKLQGKDIGVAVVDSGVVRTRDLNKRLRTSVNFNESFHNSADRYGHGTFVAGIVAGNGAYSMGRYIGVAPRADIYNIRVSDDHGMARESDVVEALQWIYENRSQHNIRIVNLSLNSSVAQSYHTSPMAAACEILWFNGIVVVVSAGNNTDGVLYPPANDPFVITVGSVDDKGTPDISDDEMTGFSTYGIGEEGFSKPDLVAPGKNIIGLLPDNERLTMSSAHPENRIDKHYFRMSGTSVSAPIVSGALALLLQDEPGLTPDQVKYRVMATANQTWAGYDPVRAGSGYLDAYAAVNGTTMESANTGLPVSALLTTGSDPVNSSVSWNSVSWNSVSWNSVSWNSVSWNSVSWNTVAWNTDYWGE